MISPTILKQQTIQELTNIISIKPLDIQSIRTYFISRSNEFEAGNLKHYFHDWNKLTSDKEMPQTVLGLKLEFWVAHHKNITPIFLIITKSEHETGECISPIFIRQKPDGSCKFVLNLKNLNKDMPYIHFKMETLQSVLSLITPGCYLASLDLKDAYYSVPIHPDHTKFLKFI